MKTGKLAKSDAYVSSEESIPMLQIEIHSPTLKKEVDALIGAGLYPDPHTLIVEALENLVREKKKSHLDASIQLYQAGEVTLARASELAGLHRFEFEEVLKTRGILKIVEVGSVEELKEGVSLIKSFHREKSKTKE
ncbi:MAG: UPF0175 family protein [Candidatus Poribacteria bacterium]|nr:UPF0175 family protein [Candidatus Poribacteria bacterium]